MTNKQQAQSQVNDELSVSAELLLRPHKLTEEIIDRLRKKNNETAIELDIVDYWGKSCRDSLASKRTKLSETNAFVEYENPRSKKDKLLWLEQVQNQRSGAFYSLKNLIQNDILREEERELFNTNFPVGIEDFPYREIYQFHRIKRNDGSEYFSTHEQWTGITKTAGIKTISVSDLYWYTKPTVKYDLRNNDGSPIREGQSIADNKTVQLATTKMGPNDIIGTKTYITPFTSEIASPALKLAHGSIQDKNNGHSCALIKEGTYNPISVKNAELWVNASFDDLWEQATKTTPQINIDSHDLLNYLKGSEGSKHKDAYQ